MDYQIKKPNYLSKMNCNDNGECDRTLYNLFIVLNFLLSSETGMLILSIISFHSMFADITESFLRSNFLFSFL
jgi:hypothetical protein